MEGANLRKRKTRLKMTNNQLIQLIMMMTTVMVLI